MGEERFVSRVRDFRGKPWDDDLRLHEPIHEAFRHQKAAQRKR